MFFVDCLFQLISKVIRFACGYQRSTFIPGGDLLLSMNLLAISMSVSYQGCGVVSRTRTLRHGAYLSRQSVRQVLYTCTNSSACQSFVHAHMSVYKDVMSFRSASASMFLTSRFVIVLVCIAGFSALSLSSMRW